MFFNAKNSPIAVFLTDEETESITLFEKLYRNTWTALQDQGIKVRREIDITLEEWEIICKKPSKQFVPIEAASLLKMYRNRITTDKDTDYPDQTVGQLAVLKYFRPDR
jgi:ribonuclease I